MKIPAQQEAQILSHYLIKRSPTNAQMTLYEAVNEKRVQSHGDKTYAFALSHPYVLPYLDAYDAFFRPNSQLRQHLYLMFSILEASPENTELFLPNKRPMWYLFAVIGHGTRAVYRLLVGFVLVKAKGL